MKRVIWKMLVVWMCLVLVSGCQSAEVPDGEGEHPPEDLVYLADYPDEVVPLYKPVVIDNSRFSVRDDLNYVIGKDLYYISYEADATREELSAYYQDLLDEIDEEMFFSEYFFEGDIQGRRVMVSIPEQARDQALGTPIQLSVGMPRAEYQDVNPYFNDYPEDIIEVFGFFRLQEYTYSEDYLYKYARYATVYETRATSEEILEFYREKYKDKNAFTESQETDTTVFIWEDGVYRCMVRYGNHPNTQFLQLLVDRDL